MLVAAITHGLGSNSCPTLDYPHQLIDRCLDLGWQSIECELFGWSLLDCLPNMLTQSMVDALTKRWPDRERLAAIRVAGRVVLQLKTIFDMTRLETVTKVEAARVAAAATLANIEFGGIDPTRTAEYCISALETENNPEVARHLLMALANSLSEDTPETVIQRGLLAFDRYAGATSDPDVSALALSLLKQVEHLRPSPPPPEPPKPPEPEPEPEKAVASRAWYVKPLLLASAAASGVLLATASWHVVQQVRRDRVYPIYRLGRW